MHTATYYTDFGKACAHAMVDKKINSVNELASKCHISSVKMGRILHTKDMEEICKQPISFIETIGNVLNIKEKLFNIIFEYLKNK